MYRQYGEGESVAEGQTPRLESDLQCFAEGNGARAVDEFLNWCQSRSMRHVEHGRGKRLVVGERGKYGCREVCLCSEVEVRIGREGNVERRGDKTTSNLEKDVRVARTPLEVS